MFPSSPVCLFSHFCERTTYTGFCFPYCPYTFRCMGQVFLQSSVWLLLLLCLLRRIAYTYHKTTIAPESVGMVTVATLPHNSPVRCVDLSIGVRPLWIPKTLTSPISRGFAWFCFLFMLTHHVYHTIQAAWEVQPRAWGWFTAVEPTLAVYRDAACSFNRDKGWLLAILTVHKQHLNKFNDRRNLASILRPRSMQP